MARKDSKFIPSNPRFKFSYLPFYWTARINNKYSHRMDTILKKNGMNITEWRVAMILRENGAQSVSEIATHAVSRMPTITKTIYRMRKKKLVNVNQDKTDKRVSMISLTSDGYQIVDDILQQTTRLFLTAYDGLSSQEINGLNQSLQRIFWNLS